MFLFCLLVAAAGCKEEGGIKVTSFTFNGAKAVTPAQLKSVLATSASSRLPWGTKHYFSRDQFDADLKRIVAFYKDRGYPDARIASTDVKLNDDQTSVKLAINIDEGEPVRVERVVFTGFDALPAQHRTVLESKLPLRAGQPLDRALMQASRESALDELRDHGFPYASVRMSEVEGASPKSRVVSLVADPGPLSTFGPIEIVGKRVWATKSFAGSLRIVRGVPTGKAHSRRVSGGFTHRSCSSSPMSSRCAATRSRPKFQPA